MCFKLCCVVWSSVIPYCGSSLKAKSIDSANWKLSRSFASVWEKDSLGIICRRWLQIASALPSNLGKSLFVFYSTKIASHYCSEREAPFIVDSMLRIHRKPVVLKCKAGLRMTSLSSIYKGLYQDTCEFYRKSYLSWDKAVLCHFFSSLCIQRNESSRMSTVSLCWRFQVPSNYRGNRVSASVAGEYCHLTACQPSDLN